MKLYVFFGVSVCLVGHAVRGDMELASQGGDKQHSSAFLMMYKFMDDIFAMKNQINELQSTVGDRQEGLENKLNELKNTVEDQEEGIGNQINELQNKVDDRQEKIVQLEYVNDQLESQINERRPNKDSGATYIRWGRTDCPSMTGAVKIYEGYAAGDHYTHAGGGVELLCLPRVPTWGKYSDSHIAHAYVYGAEFQISGANSDRLFGKDVHDENLPCVMCQSVGRFAVVRIPGRTNCYSGWTEEYTGYLFAGYHGHVKSTDYTCIDSDPEYVEGKTGSQDGRLLYPVEANCHANYGLQCPPYEDGRELACVVCTK